jgi:hypothetical protein
VVRRHPFSFLVVIKTNGQNRKLNIRILKYKVVFSFIFILSIIFCSNSVSEGSTKIFDNGTWWIAMDSSDPLLASIDVYLNDVSKGQCKRLDFGHKVQGIDSWPTVAALYSSGYLRLKECREPDIKFGTSFILGPAYWENGNYYHNPQLTKVHIDTKELPSGPLRIQIAATNGSLNLSYDIETYDPTNEEIRVHVNQTWISTRSFSIDAMRQANHGGFKLVQFSSMYMNGYYHDSDGAQYIDKNGNLIRSNFTNSDRFVFNNPERLECGWLECTHSDNYGWQSNTPNCFIQLGDQGLGLECTPQGWIRATSDPNDDNIGLWINQDTVSTVENSGSVSYWLLAKDDPFGVGCYIGAYLGCGTEDLSCEGISDFNKRMGKRHAIFLRYVDISDSDNPDHWSWAQEVKASGAAPMFIYDPWAGLDNIDMDKVKSFALSCNDFKVPIFIVFGHEMNGFWYPWGNKPETYKQKFKQVAEIFHQYAKNVYMCWVPNQNWGYPWDGIDYGDGYSEYYPEESGDYGEYVDWVGLNFYDKDYDENNQVTANFFIDNIKSGQDGINFYEIFAVGKNTLMLIAETAASDPNKDPTGEGERIPLTLEEQASFKNDWINQVYSVDTLRSEFPKLKAICYFHVEKRESIDTQNHHFHDILVDYKIPDTLPYNIYNTLISDGYFLSSISPILPGDANGDGSINVQDVICIINVILDTGTASGNPDCNDDGNVNVLDVICVINKILGI